MRVVKARNRTILHEIPEKNRMEVNHFVNEELRRQIEKRAYELFQGRGYVHGRDLEDWLEAEEMMSAGRIR